MAHELVLARARVVDLEVLFVVHVVRRGLVSSALLVGSVVADVDVLYGVSQLVAAVPRVDFLRGRKTRYR